MLPSHNPSFFSVALTASYFDILYIESCLVASSTALAPTSPEALRYASSLNSPLDLGYRCGAPFLSGLADILPTTKSSKYAGLMPGAHPSLSADAWVISCAAARLDSSAVSAFPKVNTSEDLT